MLRLLTTVAMAAAGLLAVSPAADATSAGANGLIAYDQFRGGTDGSQIWTVNPTTRVQSNISGSFVDDQKPRFAPTGTVMVFVHDSEIWSMTASGANRVDLTPGESHSQGSFDDPSYSPDGSQIVYTVNGTLQVMNSTGSNQHTLLPGGDDSTPAWSPDGTKIAFTSYRVGDVKQIFTYTLATGAITDLSNDTSDADQSPDWSPDGTHLVFTSNRDSTAGGFQTWQMKADGTDKVNLSNYPYGAYDGAYSPDGKSITFAGNERVNGLFQVLTQVIGGDAGAVTAEPDNSGDGHMSWQAKRTLPSPAGNFYGLAPTRILDTRSGLGAPRQPLGVGGVLQLQVAGKAGLPAAGVSAVVLNVTVTGASTGGYLTVYPTGVSRPNASTLNFAKGATLANSVTVALGTGGKVDLYNASGTTQVIADVVGFYTADATILSDPRYGYPGGHTVGLASPQRSVDTRVQGGPIAANHSRTFPVTLGAANSHIHALVVNLTAVAPTATGYLTLWSGQSPRPGTSTLNFAARAPAATNFAVVPVTGIPTPTLAVFNGSAAPVDVIVDVLGYIDDTTLPAGLTYHPLTPTRIVDTRRSVGIHSALTAKQTGIATTPATVGNSTTTALAINLTAVAPTVGTYLTVFADGTPRPNSSNLNPAAGQTVANAAFTLISPARRFDIFNASGVTNVLVDVAGYYSPA